MKKDKKNKGKIKLELEILELESKLAPTLPIEGGEDPTYYNGMYYNPATGNTGPNEGAEC